MQHVAFEISNREMAQLIFALVPELAELDYEEDLEGNFLVVDYPEPGKWVLVMSDRILDTWDHIEPGSKFKTVRFVK